MLKVGDGAVIEEPLLENSKFRNELNGKVSSIQLAECLNFLMLHKSDISSMFLRADGLKTPPMSTYLLLLLFMNQTFSRYRRT